MSIGEPDLYSKQDMRAYGDSAFATDSYQVPELTFTDYQNYSGDTAIYPDVGDSEIAGVVYPALGLVNEAGEFAGKIKKLFRDKQGKLSSEDAEALRAELGDVMWYLSQCASELGLSLREVAQNNLDKLQSRKERGVLQGSGDNR